MEKLLNRIKVLGWRGKIVSVNHLSELQDSIYYPYSQGLIDKELFKEQLDFLTFDLPVDLPNATSIIFVAVPTPQMRITINWHGKSIFVIIPPTNVNYTPRTQNTQKILAEYLKNEGYHLVKAQLPLKTLAVRSGLAEYGSKETASRIKSLQINERLNLLYRNLSMIILINLTFYG